MSDLSYHDRVFSILSYCKRRRHIPDLHSFVASIENGTVFVQYDFVGFWIEERTYDEAGNETVNNWSGTIEEAANRLEKLKIDLLSVEM